MSYELQRGTPESQGIPSPVIAEILRDIETLDYVKGIVILRHGTIVTEGYWKPFEKQTCHALWSLSKSFTSCAIGLAQDEGLLKISDKLISFFPEYRSCVTDDKMLEVTLQDLLTMRSGHAQCAFPYASSDSSKDWVRGFLRSPLQFEPGTHFAYNSLGTYMLAAIIRRVTGNNVREYLTPRLFEPLGITPGVWDSCPAGTDCGGFGFHLTTMDIAVFSQLLLNKGKWNGVQLLPRQYIEEAIIPHADNSMNKDPDWKCGYGYQFWRSRHGFRGDGACGQYAVVLPEYDMAIAVNSSMTNMGRMLDIFWDKLLPALSDVPLPEDPEAAAALEFQCRSLELLPAKNDLEVKRKNCAFTFFPNSIGIESGKLEFSADGCVLELKTPHGTEAINAGFGKFEMSTIRIHDIRSHQIAGHAVWKNENTLEIKVFFIDSTFRDSWVIEFKNGTAEFRWQTACSLFRPGVPPLGVREFSEY